MFAKKLTLKAKNVYFSSDDSQDTDYSMESSLEIAESNTQNSSANKFHQLRETMNQLFLANPELANEIKFEQYYAADDYDVESPKNHPVSPRRIQGSGSITDLAQQQQQAESTAPPVNNASSKFWGVIGKEMTKQQKNSKLPSLPQINHILNIYKTKIDKNDAQDAANSPPKRSSMVKAKADLRIQSAKMSGEKNFSSLKPKSAKNGLQSPQGNASMGEEEEDGVTYYSTRKKTHLKFKQRRAQLEAEELQRKKELEIEQEKLAKEREQKQMMSTLAELDEELMKNKAPIEDADGEGTTRNTLKPKPRQPSRENTLRPVGNIFERLTKDLANKKQTEEDDDPNAKRIFISPFAETLYKDMKAFGDPEAFKKIAQARIMNYKKEFKEKLAKQKQVPQEGLKFSKENLRHLNMFLPDYEKSMPVQNKEAIFANSEVISRDLSQEDRENNPEIDILSRYQKIWAGNILELWKESKDDTSQ